MPRLSVPSPRCLQERPTTPATWCVFGSAAKVSEHLDEIMPPPPPLTQRTGCAVGPRAIAAWIPRPENI